MLKQNLEVKSELTNVLQRPSSGRTQDISHILARTFGEKFLKDPIDPLILKNLRVTTDGSNDYQKKYASQLMEICDERQKRLDMCTLLEESIKQAKAKAISADQKHKHINNDMDKISDLGLPTTHSLFRSCLDNELLHSNGLLCGYDLGSQQKSSALIPTPRDATNHAITRNTSASVARSLASRNTESSGAAAELNALRDLDEESTHINPGSEVNSEDNFPTALQPISPTGYRQHDSKSMLVASGASGGHRSSGLQREDSRQKRVRKVEEKRNRLWKEHADAENRAEARQLLAHMQNFVNYKPNPSFIKPNSEGGTGILNKNITDLKQGEEVDIFVPKPNVVLFTEYEIGKVYELSVELRNISCACRYLRIIPPKTKYFSVGLGQFPGDDGSIAPGLACHYKIRFSPDSVGDFDDEIVVESQSEKSLVIPLKAHRPAPNLTLPDVIDIGQCLLLGYKISKIKVKNNGGKGKFAIIPRSAWPSTNFKMIVNPDVVTLPPFHLRPAILELDKDQSCVLEVVFSPLDEQVYKTEFSLICDNCQVKHFCLTGQGERANVQLVSVEGGTSFAYPGESSDVSASALIRFESIHPFTMKNRNVRIRNATNVELPFVWKVTKPHCVPHELNDSEKQIATMPAHRIIDIEAPFSMEPAMGLLGPRAEVDFQLKFAPTKIAAYHCSLHMILQNIPDIHNSHQTNGTVQKQSTASVTLIDVTALEIELKGAVKALDVRVEPAAVVLAGKILVGTTVRRQIKMTNYSDCAATFCWEGQASGHILEVEPRMGMINAGQFGYVELCVTGDVACKLERTLLCHIENSDTPVALQVFADIKGQEVIIDQPDLSFGLVRLNQSCVRTLSLRNANQMLTRWRLIFPVNYGQYFTASQELGELRPLEKIDVEITFTPQEEFKNMKEIIEVAVENSSSVFTNVVAEVQRPHVCLLDCQIEMLALYQCIESTYTCELYNQTELPTAFSWLPAQGQDAAFCKVRVEPSEGLLRPREQLTVKIALTCQVEGELSDLIVPCAVDGVDNKLLLQLYGTCQGLSVIYSTPSTEEMATSTDVVLLDFGSVQVHSLTKRVLRMHNNTAIKARYSIVVDYFRASAEDYCLPDSRSSTLEQEDGEAKDLSDANAIRLKKRPNLADPSSKPPKYAFYDMCKTMLQEKKGAAFHCKPSHGELQAFETLDVEISAFTDMWGHYDDFLIVRIDNLEQKCVPLRLQVEGSPIEFTMNAGRSEQKPVVRFGTHSRGAKSITRPIRLNNKSPFAVRLDWEVYNSTQSPSKLLDLVTIFGRVFPPLDSNGAEILPLLSKPKTPPARMPTEMLPNSPDSSVVLSNRVDDLSEYELMDTDRETIISKRDPSKELQIITLNVRPHEGVLASAPFSVSPTQLIIPPESYEYVHVTFNPHYEENVAEKLLQFNSFACAFLSVEESATFVQNKVIRKQAYDIDPMRLEFTGRLEIPELVVEYDEDDEERFVFDVPLSKLIANEATMELLSSTLIYAKAVIRNDKETPLRFTIQVNSPFQLHDSTNKAVTATRCQSELKIELAPRQSFPLKVGFELSSAYLHNIDDATRKECVLRYEDAVALLFNNGSRQLLPLLATIHFPKLELSKEHLDFGTCFVGQTRELQLQVSNCSGSASLWTAHVESHSVNCLEQTFVLSPAKGYLQAAVTHVSKNKEQLSVFFTPSHSDHYKCVIVFNGVFGEEPKRLLISGQGSYDGCFEAVYNV